MEKAWHSLTIDEALEIVASSRHGLSQAEAEARLKVYGFNEIKEVRKRHPVFLFLNQFKSVLILILMVAALISLALGDLADTGVIMFIVFMNAVLGFYQEYKAEQAVEALKKMAAPQATVVRDGEKRKMYARELVVGDVVLLEAGDRVPADVRLIEAVNLRVDESALTGESVPVVKYASVLLGEDTPLGSRANMAYMGTVVARGRGVGVVVATGMNTEFGRVAALVQTVKEEETPLQRRMGELGGKLGLAAVLACGIIFLAGLMRGIEILKIFLASVSLAVAVVPEGLPAIVTITLALGVQRMARRNAIIRKLPSVETLGCATVICSDKTGTITKNEMTVREVYIPHQMISLTSRENAALDEGRNQHLRFLFEVAALCNDAELKREGGRWKIIGDPTEGALLVAAENLGIRVDDLREKHPRIFEIPFESERKRMDTVNLWNGGAIVCVKGAPEVVLGLSSMMLVDGALREIGDEERERILDGNRRMAERALRVLAVAYKEVEVKDAYVEKEVEEGLVFLGLVGMMDPPRDEAKSAVEKCKSAGIKVVMITGDNELTARAIASEVGIFEENDLSMTGTELEKIDVNELEKVVEKVRVYARVSPEHKLKIVSALKRRGHVVAMTGDGVNDAPALKKADIGVAMGVTGTDVAKETADMVLSDDNFATIVSAVEEGRTIYSNIKKTVYYLLASNIGELLTIFIAMMIGLPLPLTAAQILWINLVTDSFPALALAVEPPEEDVMRRPPRDPKAPFIGRGSILELLGCGLVMSCVTLLLYSMELGTPFSGNYERAKAIAFITLILFQIFNAANYRSEYKSLFQMHPFSNKYFILSIAIAFALQLVVVYVPALQPMFETYPITALDWMFIIAASSSIIAFYEAKKVYQRRKRRS
ncbi:MAG: calcium-transporting P-type ATPase, PMR1-type [Candidatus Freyarchaeota archaeon]|nr:calcium-transporting P-type ATPase, PMR1-type [Candidatus Jordarchaeia archaeon]